ncbi:MAG: DUF2460 domain-containing protein [Rickettsiaceae bacterium]|nr:DUF2460 domain-containing protein [Rickettsiaceae bacterium]MDP4832151.1 DUF2460 domain-containing protein [Rickettsiaceae bacterium]MDP5020347.1 DUF2460 domain-containing protein [Rickettsiaceae bacterium]
MNFHDVRLPQYIEIFAVGSAEFSTSMAVSMSGREVRNSDSQIPKRRYNLRNCLLSANQFEAFNSFFQARAGKRFSFRLRDHFDYKVEKQIIATSDGVNAEFQLQKTYADAISPYIRVITKPIVDSVTIWVENNPVEIESIEASSGKVKLAYVLEKNVEICASFVFDVPVRFAADNFQYSFNSDGSIKVEDVELIEVYE